MRFNFDKINLAYSLAAGVLEPDGGDLILFKLISGAIRLELEICHGEISWGVSWSRDLPMSRSSARISNKFERLMSSVLERISERFSSLFMPSPLL